MYFALELKWSLGDNLNKYFAKCLQFVLYLYNSYHMACTEGQSYVVELMVNNQFKAFLYQFERSKCEWNDSFNGKFGYYLDWYKCKYLCKYQILTFDDMNNHRMVSRIGRCAGVSSGIFRPDRINA